MTATPRYQWLDHRERPDGSPLTIHWPLSVIERYCVDSGQAVKAIPGDRCRLHSARGVICTTAERMPPKCEHPQLSPNHPYPCCSECGVKGEDVTVEVFPCR